MLLISLYSQRFWNWVDNKFGVN